MFPFKLYSKFNTANMVVLFFQKEKQLANPLVPLQLKKFASSSGGQT